MAIVEEWNKLFVNRGIVLLIAYTTLNPHSALTAWNDHGSVTGGGEFPQQ